MTPPSLSLDPESTDAPRPNRIGRLASSSAAPRRVDHGSPEPTVVGQPVLTFALRFDPMFRAALLPLAVTPGRAHVEVHHDRLVVQFGLWHVATSIGNIASAEVSGPYPRSKVIGGPRLSFADHGLTFATNAQRGVCILFVRPVVGIDPTGRMCHPGLTVTVADPDGLAAILGKLADRCRRDGVVAHASVDDRAEISSLTGAELRTRARDLGLSGVGRLRRSELIDLLCAPDFPLP